MRVPKPFFVKARKTWYVQLNGKQHNLGKDKTKVLEAYKALMASDDAAPVADLASPRTTVLDIVDEFLEWTKRHKAQRTYEWYLGYLDNFSKWLKRTGQAKLLVRDFRPYHVTKWMDKEFPKVEDSSRAGIVTAIKRPFNWAADEGYIKDNPIARIKKPSYQPRGDEAYITDEQWETVLAAVKEKEKSRPHEVRVFLDYLTTIRDTGCRPQEIRLVEARHMRLDEHVWYFPADESKGKKIARVVPLTEEVVEICRRLALKYPEGPLYRNVDGNPWTAFAVNNRFQTIAEKTEIHLCAYKFRHTFATNEVKKGTDIVTLQHMMGHVSLAMLSKVYAHVERVRQIEAEAKKRAKRKDVDAA